MRFLVTGGTGFIGSHVVETLIASGADVVCPVRDTDALRYLEGMNAAIISVDEIPERLAVGPEFDYVIHIAGGTRGTEYEAFRRANVEYGRRLLGLLADSPTAGVLKRYVLVSSQSAGGPCRDATTPVREEDPPKPVSMYGRSKLEAEEETKKFQDRLPITIVRPAAVFGPRDVDFFGVFSTARYHLAPCLTGPDRLVSLIYVEDLVKGILEAAYSENGHGRTYFLADSAPVVWREFSLLTARIMGYSAVPLYIPVSLARVAGLVGDLMCKMSDKPPLMRSDKLKDVSQLAWICSVERAAEELGWTASTPLEDAIAKTAAWYRGNGWL